MNLTWNALSKFIAKSLEGLNNVSGVYIWGFRIGESFIAYYVGIAQHVPYRMAEHLNFLISVKYTIYHKQCLEKFYDYKNDDVGPNKLFEPFWPKNFDKFLERRTELSKHINYMVDNFEYTYAPYPDSIIKDFALREVEKYIVTLIGIDNLANTRGGESKINFIHHKGKMRLLNYLFQIERINEDN